MHQADEGMLFADYYGEQSCTAGCSLFITGQSVFRTGLSKVGLPGAELGLKVEDPTIAAPLKNQGMLLDGSASITSATRTNTCPPTKAATNFSATPIIEKKKEER